MVEMRIDLEKSRPVFAHHPRMYWIAGWLLSLFLMAGFMNGRANERVIEAQNAACHWTIQHELRDQAQRLERQ